MNDDQRWECKCGVSWPRQIAVGTCGCERPMPRYARMLKDGGLTKLMEECGELTQIAAKKSAFIDVKVHPDGEAIDPRLEGEMGDVLAAIDYVCEHHGLDMERIQRHRMRKRQQFDSWKEVT